MPLAVLVRDTRAFSRAFKRVAGVAPAAWRESPRAATSAPMNRRDSNVSRATFSKNAARDLGISLGPITGIKPGTPTVIRSLSMNLHQQAGAVRTDNIAVDVSSLGTATGNGSISAAQALDYRLNLKPTILSGTKPTGTASGGGIAGQLLGMASGGSAGNITTAALQNGINVSIGGTTSNPTFTPDLNSLASSAIKGAAGNFLNGKKGNTNTNSIGKAFGGLFGKH